MILYERSLSLYIFYIFAIIYSKCEYNCKYIKYIYVTRVPSYLTELTSITEWTKTNLLCLISVFGLSFNATLAKLCLRLHQAILKSWSWSIIDKYHARKQRTSNCNRNVTREIWTISSYTDCTTTNNKLNINNSLYTKYTHKGKTEPKCYFQSPYGKYIYVLRAIHKYLFYFIQHVVTPAALTANWLQSCLRQVRGHLGNSSKWLLWLFLHQGLYCFPKLHFYDRWWNNSEFHRRYNIL